MIKSPEIGVKEAKRVRSTEPRKLNSPLLFVICRPDNHIKGTSWHSKERLPDMLVKETNL
jgi:hypothetical protein